MPSDSDLANHTLNEEADLRFPRFTNDDAYALGQHIRKRYKATQRYKAGKGIAIAIKSAAGHVMFACSLGEGGDVSLEYWSCIEGMIATTIRTGHSSYFTERKLASTGKSPEQAGLPYPEYRLEGGAFPVWLVNATATPVAVVAVYGSSSQEDHQLVAKSLRDYQQKILEHPEGRDGSPKSTNRNGAPSTSY